MKITEVTAVDNNLQLRLNKVVDILWRDCQPFLKEIDYDLKNYSLWRALNRDNNTDIVRNKCPVNRKPRDSSPEQQELADNFFAHKFGLRFRANSLFVSGRYDQARIFGWNVYPFIPIGNFRFCWSSQISDLYSEFNLLSANAIKEIPFNTYQADTNLKKAIASGKEIMIHGDGYLLDTVFADYRANPRRVLPALIDLIKSKHNT